MSEKVKIPKRHIITRKPFLLSGRQRIICPYCGNDEDFFEVAENVTITTHYIQNEDGSFTPVTDDTELLGEVRFYCGRCHADLTQYHKQFLEMLF